MKAAALCLACLLWLGAAPLARAVELADAVPGHPGLTYFDLVKLLAKDLDRDGAATRGAVVPFTHIEGKDQTGEPPEAIALDSTDIDAMAIPGDDSRLLLLVDLGAQEGFVAHAALLGLFSLASAPKLLGVVEVGMAETTVFARKTKPIMMAPRTPLILLDSEHDNADESFVVTQMIFIRDDRFQLIGSFSIFDEKQCAYTRIENPSFAVQPGSGAYPTLSVAVRLRVTLTGETGCSETEKAPRARAATYQAVYRWDPQAQRFATQSTQLQGLAKENEKSP
jgi:hypothetical protein